MLLNVPSKNRIKEYRPGTTYHIYNRGIDGREVFGDEGDYELFGQILKRYLVKQEIAPDSIYKKERPYILRRRENMNLADQLELLALCLMPDHFHLLLWQMTEEGMKKLMRRAVTNYVMYYNRKYKRAGPLFENVYRAVIIPDKEKVVWMSKYMHLNQVSRQVKRYGLVETVSGTDPEYYMYSSYPTYLGKEGVGVVGELVRAERVKKWFAESNLASKWKTYRRFMEEPVGNWQEVLGGLLLE